MQKSNRLPKNEYFTLRMNQAKERGDVQKATYYERRLKELECVKSHVQILVTCQVKENYNTDTITPPFWKNKGGHNFIFSIDMCDWMYDEENAKKYICNLIEQHHNNEMFRYEPVEWERFDEPEFIGVYKSNTINEILEA